MQKSIATCYAEIGAAETQLNAESQWLSDREAWLKNQILTSPDFKTQLERGSQLAGIQALKGILPERVAKLREQIFDLHTQIEQQKQK